MRVIYVRTFVVAKFPVGGVCAYSISKSAVEVFSDCMRLEMRPWGIHVSVIEHLGYKTGNQLLGKLKIIDMFICVICFSSASSGRTKI